MAAPRVAIVDYGMGNIHSVKSALNYLGAEAELVDKPENFREFQFLVLPGVGSFRRGMETLTARGLDQAIREGVQQEGKRILGICLGMQMLGAHSSEDGGASGLNLIPNLVERFKDDGTRSLRIPHVGFNNTEVSEPIGLFRDLPENADFYFVHSYRMPASDLPSRHAICEYGDKFLAAFEVGNICGTQFHPEKSQTNGLILLRNFLQRRC